MESFLVSARKYRPATFNDVVGQPHVATTIKNAIRNNQLAQAFLFCGPRGVGKTTCARILAKTINCQHVTADIEPCNSCISCTSFNHHSSFNIYELDAASNNSVEDIRSLVEQTRYSPQAGQYKVYIIDEVHMLSNAAFNAFLKTLEEPPSYAIFILATTEKHKIIPTILSRCQIFDFHRIQPQDIVQQLKRIAQQEGISYEEEALHLISQKSDGALRDALSVFDLITTFTSGQGVTIQATLEHLHILDYTYYFKITDACLQYNPGAALLSYDEILKEGFDGQHFIAGLSEHFRNLMMSQDASTLPLLAVADDIKKQYQIQAARTSLSFLFRALHITNQCDLHYKNSANKRLHVEMALIELSHIQEPSQPVETIEHEHTRAPSNPLIPTPAAKPTPVTSHNKSIKTNSNESGGTTARTIQKVHTFKVTTKLPQIDQLKKSLGQKEETPCLQPTSGSTVEQLPITQQAVSQHWHAYASKLKSAGRMSEYSLLNQKIVLEGITIIVKLVNVVQQDILAGIKEDLMVYLRKALRCPALDLRGVMASLEKNVKPYTAQARFKYLTERYPDVCILQEKLSLEVQD
ncbi:MAG: DNA polymerase III subunit gamma/tau [Amoebophilaceae bacterium]|jgi:DNA polymerase-3 subunit gamma/tau|nr:DNA polymerase III subunit gamma/tau [Amoebophilaceae bacterium]